MKRIPEEKMMRRIKTPDVHLHFGLGLEAVNCRRLGETFEEDFKHTAVVYVD